MVFLIFSIFYVGTVVGNLLIMVTIKRRRTLRSPLYFFLFHLSFADSCFSTATAPRLLAGTFSARKVTSYNECMTQVFMLHFFGCLEIFVLILIAVDFYVAICKPLHYPSIISRQPLLKLTCMDTHMVNLLVVLNSGAICSSSFIFLMISYFVILHSL
ncbi:Olfactory receptor 4C11 [Heterocephalus glaber]|uniref:Olfactory receptor 4C11 n=1 Tax=Heterocephalus glaber TaxID=10181 RepID=G5AZD1_HETGA|nr:Olfactory receptor 4C11 [Heterocephalus glaber]